MKRILNILVLLIGFLVVSNVAKASHFAAADIYYEYLSPLKYKVHLVLYRDCKPNNAGFIGTEQIDVTSTSCGQTLSLTVDTTGNNTRKIYGDLCPNVDNWCVNTNSIFPGYEEWHYTGEITLPMACTDWVFNYSSCCRNGIIANIGTSNAPNTSGGLSFCVSAGLNNVARAINNSPQLSIKPIPYVCVNQPKTYLNGPLDPDLDSLHFTPVAPLGLGGCNPAAWVGTSNVANPLGAAAPGGYSVDPLSGTATFTPIAQGAYVLAFRCDDIDPNTGTLLGYVSRDVQINVLNCNSAPPSFTNNTQNYVLQNVAGHATYTYQPNLITVCPGSNLSFDVTAISQSGSNFLLTSSNNASSCPGSTYTPVPSAGGVSGHFTWTPAGNQVGNHTLIIQFTDSTCTVAQPIVLKSYCVVQIKVLPGVDAGPDLYYCLGLDSIQFLTVAPGGIPNWLWTDINGSTSNLYLSSNTVQNPKAAPLNTTTYVVTGLNAPVGITCKLKDTVTINVDKSNTIDAVATPSVICKPGLVQLSATPSGLPPSYVCGEENVPCISPENQYAITGPVGAATGVTGVYTPFSGFESGGRCQILVSAAELQALGLTKGRINSVSFDIVNKFSTSGFDMHVKMGCIPSSANQLVGFYPQSALKEVYANANYNTTVGINTIPLNTPFIWDGVSSIVVEVCFYNGFGSSIGGDEVNYTQQLTNMFYMQNAQYGGCEIPNTIGLSVPAATGLRPNITFGICDIPTKPWTYKWTPAAYIFDSTQQSTNAYVDGMRQFYVYSKAGNGCVVVDSVTVTLGQHGVFVTPSDTTVCFGDAFPAIATGWGNAPSQSFFWYNQGTGNSSGLSCVNCNNPIITPSSAIDSVFVCVRTDSYNCNDTAYVHINVNNVPNVSILNGNSITLPYQQQVNLIANGAQVYSWAPTWSSSNPNYSNNIVSPQETTTYVVYGINEFGCGDYDTIQVNIDYGNNMFVPTAFTPNGDGINDVFKVTNLNFYKIQEFKVLNRWGQLVFNANDNRGWNGTFKGTNQDPDTYFYLIKAASPDGPVKVFKGDVILIR